MNTPNTPNSRERERDADALPPIVASLKGLLADALPELQQYGGHRPERQMYIDWLEEKHGNTSQSKPNSITDEQKSIK